MKSEMILPLEATSSFVNI